MSQIIESPHDVADSYVPAEIDAGRDVATKADPSAVPGGSSVEPRRLSPLETWMLAAWFALSAGLIEAAWVACRRFLMGDFVFTGDHFFWMSPLAQLTAATVICLPMLLVAGRVKAWTEDAATVLFGFLAAINVILLAPKLHFVAVLLLAAGVSVQCGRWVRHRPGRLLGVVKASLVWMFLVVATCALVTTLVPGMAERRATAALPPSRDDAPNVLLIVLDTVRADALELEGSGANSRTPNLHRLARQGFVFRQAHSTSPWTLPSHASLLTGRLPRELSTGWHAALDDKYPTIAEWMRDRGYRTGAFVGNTRYCSKETGLDRGFGHFSDYQISVGNFLLATAWGRYLTTDSSLMLSWGCCDVVGRRTAASVHGDFLRWMDGDTTRPYFALVNLFDAHDPYVAPECFRRVSPANDQQRWLLRHWWISDKCALTDEQVEFEKTCYEDCVASIDYQIGKLLDQLRRRDGIENTLVIVTADHGEHFGDHELYGHGNSLYEPAILVPLIIWRSDATLRGVSDRTVSLTEMPATIAHEAAPDVQTPFPGETLARFFQPGRATDQESPVHSEIAKPARWPACGGRSPVFRGSMCSVIWRGYKYIRNGDGVEEIYQLAEDPAELNNLADSVSPRLRRELRSVLGN